MTAAASTPEAPHLSVVTWSEWRRPWELSTRSSHSRGAPPSPTASLRPPRPRWRPQHSSGTCGRPPAQGGTSVSLARRSSSDPRNGTEVTKGRALLCIMYDVCNLVSQVRYRANHQRHLCIREPHRQSCGCPSTGGWEQD
ncbi:hypothetical protein O3P69_001932 [Scylla paramamosain]|uniref:Uncharacterized protein n=1 Tax=Scylla paramamosain TaxID=85552 RepID=A0AAW0V586_SCYPA